MILIWILQEKSIGYNYSSDEATYGWLYKISSKSWQSCPIFMIIEDIYGFFNRKNKLFFYNS